jgi:hypothetical protein
VGMAAPTALRLEGFFLFFFNDFLSNDKCLNLSVSVVCMCGHGHRRTLRPLSKPHPPQPKPRPRLMASFQYLVLLSTAAATAVGGRPDRLGPGAGPWTVASPDSVGLDAEMLRQAEETVNARVGGRTCFVVVKDGKIVHETYRGSGGVNVISEGYSTTKSQCSTLFGIAREQGWASPFESIASRNSGTRQCNADAEFRHSLSMTGQSANLDSPTFSYDTLGTQCLDTISDFIDENNPDGLNAEEWKDRYWQQPLGLEHSRWVGGSGLACGTSSVVSCRDLARTALVWANDGQWPEEGQMVRRDAS